MKISRKADYGLLALTYLARQKKGHICYRNEIARRFRISRTVLAKILQSLRRGGILRSHLGAHGGYSLARPPAKITLAEVLKALGADVRMPRGRSHAKRHAEPGLAARVAAGLQAVTEDVQQLFSRVSLEDLAGD